MITLRSALLAARFRRARLRFGTVRVAKSRIGMGSSWWAWGGTRRLFHRGARRPPAPSSQIQRALV